MRWPTPTRATSRGRRSRPSLPRNGGDGRHERWFGGGSSRGAAARRRWRAGLEAAAAGEFQAEVPHALDQMEELRLARLDLRGFPLAEPAQRLVQGRLRRRRGLEIDLELALEVLVAGAIVLRLGHQHQVAQRFGVDLALA